MKRDPLTKYTDPYATYGSLTMLLILNALLIVLLVLAMIITKWVDWRVIVAVIGFVGVGAFIYHKWKELREALGRNSHKGGQ